MVLAPARADTAPTTRSCCSASGRRKLRPIHTRVRQQNAKNRVSGRRVDGRPEHANLPGSAPSARSPRTARPHLEPPAPRLACAARGLRAQRFCENEQRRGSPQHDDAKSLAPAAQRGTRAEEHRRRAGLVRRVVRAVAKSAARQLLLLALVMLRDRFQRACPHAAAREAWHEAFKWVGQEAGKRSGARRVLSCVSPRACVVHEATAPTRVELVAWRRRASRVPIRCGGKGGVQCHALWRPRT